MASEAVPFLNHRVEKDRATETAPAEAPLDRTLSISIVNGVSRKSGDSFFGGWRLVAGGGDQFTKAQVLNEAKSISRQKR